MDSNERVDEEAILRLEDLVPRIIKFCPLLF